MNNWAIIPVKPLVRAKSRLATILTIEQRKALAEKMFRHSLDVVINHSEFAGVSILSRDSTVMTIARKYGARTIQESGVPALNTALHRASEIVRLEGWSSLLVLPADLPLITLEDIDQILSMGRYLMTVVIAPDRHEDNTNALFMRPVGLIQLSFGPGSFQRHIELARKAGATVQIYRSRGIGLDIDTPADLDLYREIRGGDTYPTMMDSLTEFEAHGEGLVWNQQLEYG